MCFEVLPGIMLTYDDIRMRTFWKTSEPSIHQMRINHCKEGLFQFTVGRLTRSIRTGDLYVSNPAGTVIADSVLPTGRYKGFSISVEQEKAALAFNAMQLNRDINIRALCRCIQNCEGVVSYPQPELEQAVHALYEIENCGKPILYKLKVIELVAMLFDSLMQQSAPRRYFSEAVIHVSKQIHAAFINDPLQKITVEQLAQQGGIAKTNLCACFKHLYGMPPALFLRTLKMRYCAEKLKASPQISIIELALSAGYSNPSKFSSAFKAVLGVSPLTYRRLHTASGSNSRYYPIDVRYKSCTEYVGAGT